MHSEYKHFFAYDTDLGIQASFADAQGRKNYQITKAPFSKESREANVPIPMAIESFALKPDDYAELMDRIEEFLTRSTGNKKS